MKKEERIKTEIQRLKAQSDYQKFEFGQYTAYYIGGMAILIAIFIPIVIYFINKNLISFVILSTLILLILLLVIYKFVHSLSRKNLNRIEEISKKMNKLYDELLA